MQLSDLKTKILDLSDTEFVACWDVIDRIRPMLAGLSPQAAHLATQFLSASADRRLIEHEIRATVEAARARR